MNTVSATYVFSFLSERSLCLARSVTDEDATICFVNIPQNVADTDDLVNACRASSFQLHSDTLLHFLEGHPLSGQKLYCFLINDDEEVNLRDAIRLSSLYAGEETVSVYTYTSSAESEPLIDGLNILNHSSHLQPMRLRRVLPVRREIYELLAGRPPFDAAVTIRGERWINLVIAGMNLYGLEMLRAMLWFSQMDGYFLRIDLFDPDPDVEKRFAALCPGITDRGSQPRMGEDYYDLHFHPGIHFDSADFYAGLQALPSTSQVFIDTGSDQGNMACALKLRAFYSGLKMEQGIFDAHTQDTPSAPVIYAVIQDDDRAELIAPERLKNFRGQYYHITPVGNNRAVYNIKRLLQDPMEEKALALHLQMSDAASFEMYEYFRRSSIASAIHQRFRKEMIHDEDVAAVTEHRRWCAYMRSTEGYRYGTARDDLARRHPSLTSYNDLSRLEKEKDARLNRDVT